MRFKGVTSIQNMAEMMMAAGPLDRIAYLERQIFQDRCTLEKLKKRVDDLEQFVRQVDVATYNGKFTFRITLLTCDTCFSKITFSTNALLEHKMSVVGFLIPRPILYTHTLGPVLLAGTNFSVLIDCCIWRVLTLAFSYSCSIQIDLELS